MSDPFGGLGGFDPSGIGGHPLFREIGRVLGWQGGPVNWDAAREVASTVERGPKRLPGSERDAAELAAAVRVAELWLDAVTELPAVEGTVQALDVDEWTRLAASSEGLGVYLEPIAEGMAQAVQGGIGGMLGGDDAPPEVAGMLGMLGGQGSDALGGMLGKIGAFFYGLQAGTVLGHLGHQLFGTYDLGLPTVDPRLIATVGGGLEAFTVAEGLDAAEARHWFALREAAYRRQFAGVAWLREHVAGLVRDFATGADLDPERLMEQLGGMGIDPSALADPARAREALERSGGLQLEPTEAQRAALGGLQAVAAFTAGWTETVVAAAGEGKLPTLPRIAAAAQERRAERGTGEQLLSQLVGLDLRPADLAAGRRFCATVIAARGQRGLDRAWQDAAHLPTTAELEDPSRWLVRLAAEEDVEGDLGKVEEEALEAFEIPDDLSGLDP